MQRLIYVGRFFVIVPPMPLLMIGAFAVMTLIAIAVVLIEPERAPGALTPILLLQLFGSASGFDVPARRGHYDLLLTHGVPRSLIALAHLTASAVPGVASWLVVAAVYQVAAPGGAVSLFSAGTLVAVALVSTIPWAVTARLPRFSGAVGWLLILTTLSLVMPFTSVRITSPDSGWGTWLLTALAALVYPPLLVGLNLTGRAALVLLLAVALSAVVVAVAVWSICRRDLPLEAAQ